MPVLPPRLTGSQKGVLAVTVSETEGREATVAIKWWGEVKPQEVFLQGQAEVIYDVLTSEKHLRDYLEDAKRVVFQVYYLNGLEGFASLPDLGQVVDQGFLYQLLPVVDEDGNIIGRIQVKVDFKMEEEKENMTPLQSKSAPTLPSYRPPSKKGSPRLRKSLQNMPNPKPKLPKSASTGRVTFSDVILSDSSTSSRGPSHLAVSNDFQNDTDGLRRIMLRSKERLSRFEENEPKRRESVQESQDEKSTDLERDQTTLARGLLPSWNLSTARLHFISNITQFVVNVNRVQLTPQTVEKVVESVRRPRLVMKSKQKAMVKSANGAPNSEPIAYFIKYTMPPSDSATHHCSRKLEKNSNLFFNQKTTFSTLFKADLLDIWWTNDLTFKLYCKTLNQRVPTQIGEARIGLKYLLTDPTNSDGRELKLPIYVSQKFFNDHKMSSEIVGDIYVSFLLCGGNREKRELGCRQVSPQRPVREGDEDEMETNQENPKSSKTYLQEKRPKVVLRSKGHSKASIPQSTEEMNEFKLKEPSKPLTIVSKRNLFCLLRITEGRNFTLHTSLDGQPTSLFVRCRFLTQDDVIESQVSWNTTRPKFGLCCYIPVVLDEEFLQRCKDNFIVVEVWNFGKPDNDLVGVAMVPLQQFYLSFREEERTKLVLSLDMPVMAANDWISVNDLTHGDEKGQIRVTLAAGLDSQIRKLAPLIGARQSDLEVEKKCIKDSDSDHTYDTVEGGLSSTEDRDSSEYVEMRPGKIVPQEKAQEEQSNSQQESEVTEAQEDNEKKELNETSEKESDIDLVPNVEPFRPAPDVKHFRVKIRLNEGKNLPRVFDPIKEKKVPPSTFVTFSTKKSKTVVSNLFFESCSPEWNFETQADLNIDILSDPRRHFILKLWHHTSKKPSVDLETDHVIGFVAIDLRPLVAGFPYISGWYNVMDFVGRCRGQMKVTIAPDCDLEKLRLRVPNRRDSEISQRPVSSMSFDVTASYDDFPSHVVQHTEQLITSRPKSATGSTKSSEEDECFNSAKKYHHWTPPTLPQNSDDRASMSFLHMKLSNLDEATQKLKLRLNENILETVDSESNVDTPEPSIEEIRRDIEAKLSAFRHVMKPSETSFQTISASRRQLESSPDIPEHSTHSDVEPEIANILTDDDEIGNASRTDDVLNPFLDNVRQSTLDDLGSIDWNQILPSSQLKDNEKEEAQSRQGPEGGNPSEEDARRSKNSITKK